MLKSSIVQAPYTDVELAGACLRGEAAALDQLDALIAGVAPALASRGAPDHEVDEILQQTRTHLLVADGDRPARLSMYSGSGRLGGFIRTVAMRLWLNSRRGRREVETAPEQLQVLAGSTDPALEHLKQRYLGEFRAALAAAWKSLERDHRDLLRHQLVDALTIDDLAVLYGVHRSTAARRLVAAKDALVTATRAQLRGALGIGESEISSVLRLIETRLQLAVDVLDS